MAKKKIGKKASKKTLEVAICVKHGGFGLSDAVYECLINKHCWTVSDFRNDADTDILYCEDGWLGKYRLGGDSHEMYSLKFRTDPDVIAAIKEVGLEKASTALCKIKLVKIPAGVKVCIEEYDGWEHVAEDHRIWG